MHATIRFQDDTIQYMANYIEGGSPSHNATPADMRIFRNPEKEALDYEGFLGLNLQCTNNSQMVGCNDYVPLNLLRRSRITSIDINNEIYHKDIILNDLIETGDHDHQSKMMMMYGTFSLNE